MITNYPRTKRWTFDEIERLSSPGAILDGDHWELLDGELIKKAAKGELHFIVFSLLADALRAVAGEFKVATEGPIHFSPSDVPEPDIAILTRYTTHPDISEIKLVVEVSDTSLAYDLGPKANLYARHGVPEYWVVDVRGRAINIHSEPQNGIWSWVKIIASGVVKVGAAPIESASIFSEIKTTN